MRTPNDGEPAFPVPVGEREFWDREENGSPNGITIRDYFAAAALQGMIASGEYLAKQMHKNPNKNIGDMAYMAADEMLAARKEGA